MCHSREPDVAHSRSVVTNQYSVKHYVVEIKLKRCFEVPEFSAWEAEPIYLTFELWM